MKFLDKIPVLTLVLMSLLLGLAPWPFAPQPHVFEKLQMLADGTLTQPLDIFDLLMHGTPWVLLVLKLIRVMSRANKAE